MDTGYKERAYVVFQGGGALGIAHFGAWQAIDKNFEIVGVAGTSSGSIVAALCAAGFSPNEAFESFKRDLSELVDHKSFRWSIIDIASRVLLGRNASSDGSGFKNYLERQLEQSKLKKRDITFEELYQHKKIYLEIVACDLKNPDHPPIIFSPKENKSTSIAILNDS